MLSPAASSFALRAGAHVLAGLAFLYFLNAFVQTGYISPTQAIVGVAWLAVCYAASRFLSIAVLLPLTFLAMVLWGLFLESSPVSDFAAFHIHAAEFSSGMFSSLFGTKSPPTVAYYAVFHRLLGPALAANYIASAAAWTVGAAFVYWAARPFFSDARDARFLSFSLALCPTFLVFSPVISSESVYFLLSAICAWLVSKHLTGSGRFSYLYIAMGLVTACLFLTRTSGIVGLLVCLGLIAVGGTAYCEGAEDGPATPGPKSFRRRIGAGAIVVVSFVAVWLSFAYTAPAVLPNALWPTVSLLGGPEMRITSTPWGSLSFLFGTSFDSMGRYNSADLELAGYTGESRLTRAEADRRAREIAVERIARDPVRFVGFALSDKVAQLWGRENGLYLAASGDRQASGGLSSGIQDLALPAWTVCTASRSCSFLSCSLGRFVVPVISWPWGRSHSLLSLPHILLEVKPRYHLAMTPFIVVGSALLVLDLQRRRDEWLSTARSKARHWLDR